MAALAGACALTLLGGAVGAPAAQAGTVHTAAPAQAAAAAPGAAPAGKAAVPGASKPSTAFPVALSIDSVSPSYATSGSTEVTVSGTLYNSGKKAVHNAHLGVRTGSGGGQPLRLRSEIAAVFQRTGPVTADGLEIPGLGGALPDLAPGAKRPFKVTAKASQLGLGSRGVYELAVDVKGSTSTVSTLPATLGIARTYLPYYSQPADIKKTQIATVWPITAMPETVPQSLPNDSDSLTPVLRSDALATDLASGGRLNEVVAAGSSLSKVTWVVDGDVLDTADTMSKAYRVQHKGTEGKAAATDNTDPGTGSSQASAWLEALHTAAAGGDEVVSLPYGDPDLASIAHNGSGIAGLSTALKRATTAGDVTTDYRLGTDARTDVAWPYQGHIDPQVVATARTVGGTTLLVNGADMPESDSVTRTVNAARSIGKGIHAVVSDAPLSNLFSGDLSTRQARTLAMQRFLAETLTITLEQPNQQRSLLVMPPRNLSADAADTLAEAMAAATQGRWVSQATLGTVAKAPADPQADTKVPSTSRYPKAARATQLSHWALSRSMGTQGQLDLLMQILVSPDRVRDPFNAAILRSMSTAWRTDRTTGHSYREGVADYLQTLSSAVRLVDKSSTTLSGDSGMIQVSVENSLSQTVTNLEVRLTSASATRLTVYQPTPARLSILSELKKSVRFPAKASANGPVRMTAQLWTTGADPKPYGPPVTFDLEVTDVTSGVIWVIAGGLLLALLAGLRIYLQRKKRGKDDPEPDPDAPASPQDDPDRGSGAPQDPPGTVDDGGAPQQDASVDGADGPDQRARNEKVGP
ncbi:DUF6049 family protein [Peterkaempfera sp. SMS 1(5)a]|uniref:DUF6049 family protein n=1 Tax=Peterkaempfera podocarpi TaxID=3232308 RepID=UPI00366CF0C2